MMKRILSFLLIAILLAACSPVETAEKTPIEEEPDKLGGETTKDEVPANSDETEEISPVDKEDQVEDAGSAIPDEPESEPEIVEKENEIDNKVDSDDPEQLVRLSWEIFKAMDEGNSDFLTAILSTGSKVHPAEKMFTFENVLYPHEQDFITSKNGEDLEYRYTNAEDPDAVIIGFAAVDYENEYSYVIDIEFIKEDGVWKMNDMDINK